MSTTKTSVKETVIEIIERMKPSLKRSQITDNARPINDLGLKSVDGIVFAVELEDEFEICIDDRLNPFVDDKQKTARTISQVVTWVERVVQSKEGLFHDR